MNELELIKTITDGKIEEYAKLVNRYHFGLIIHCERLVGDRDDAEDIAQEAFLKAYNSLSKFEGHQSKFSTWLYRIATNLAFDHLRKRKKWVKVEDIEAIAKTTEPAFIKEEERVAIRLAVSKLTPPEYRKVIEEYYWHGLSYDQIAKKMNKPTGTIGTYIRRAKLQLKEDLIWIK